MRKLIASLTLCVTPAFALNPYPADPTASPAVPLRGYTAAHSTAEMEWEKKFRAIPEPDRIRENMRDVYKRQGQRCQRKRCPRNVEAGWPVTF